MSILTSRRFLVARPQAAPALIVAGLFLAGLFLAALGVAVIAPGVFTAIDPLRSEISNALAAPSAQHPFGTDQSGRDIFSRVVHGARYSLSVGFGASAIALVVGFAIGLLSGLAPRVVDSALARLIAIAMAFPEFLLALIVIAIVGPGESSLITAIACAATPAYARVARSQVLLVRRSHYVSAATSLGVSPWRSVLRHIVPNTVAPLVVLATIGVGTAIVSAAGLSFLGLGAQPPTPEWGVILSEGRNFLGTAWWITVLPGVIITATVLSVSVIGRHLQARGVGRAS